MGKLATTFATIVCFSLLALVVAEAGNNPRVSVEYISPASDCTNRTRQVAEFEGFKALFRCLDDGITGILLGYRPDPLVMDAPSPIDDDLQDVIEFMQDQGWSVEAGGVTGVPPETFNGSLPFILFTRTDCLQPNCMVSGDDVTTGAFLIDFPFGQGLAAYNWIQVGPDLMCEFGDGHIEPCFATIDCNGGKDTASCIADVGVGVPPATPDCDSCPQPVPLTPATWGKIKSRYTNED